MSTFTNTSDKNIVDQGSYFSLVLAVSKRARQIVDNHEDSTKLKTVKPVKMAEDEYANGKYIVVPIIVNED